MSTSHGEVYLGVIADLTEENEKLKAEVEELKNLKKIVDRDPFDLYKENQALRELVKGFVDLDGITYPEKKMELMKKAKEILG